LEALADYKRCKAAEPRNPIRRREWVIQIFPNEESALRLMGAVLMEIDEAWTTEHRYFDMTEYWKWRKDSVKRVEAAGDTKHSRVA
jgi:hypothetical protein